LLRGRRRPVPLLPRRRGLALCGAPRDPLPAAAGPLRRSGAAARLMRALPPAAAVALGAGYAVLLASPYELRLLSVAGAYTLLVLGYQFIFGHAGALSLAQG